MIKSFKEGKRNTFLVCFWSYCIAIFQKNRYSDITSPIDIGLELLYI